jgi:hypothetical protein
MTNNTRMRDIRLAGARSRTAIREAIEAESGGSVVGGSFKQKQARCNPAPRELAPAKALERSGYRRPHGESINGHID